MDLIRPIFYGREYEWELALSPDEVQAQLEELRENTNWWRHPLRWRIGQQKFQVARPLGFNDNTKVLAGVIEPNEGGSKIRARFRLSTSAFVAAFTLLLVSYTTPVLCVLVAAQTKAPNDFLFAGFSLTFPVIGTLVMHLISRFNAWNEKIIAESLSNHLDPFKKKASEWYPLR